MAGLGLAPGNRGATLGELRGTAFILEDGTGKTLATLKMERDGPALTMMDIRNEKPRASVGLESNKPSLHLMGDNGSALASLEIGVLGPTLWMKDELDNIGVSLRIDTNPMLLLSKGNGMSTATLKATNDGASLWMFGAEPDRKKKPCTAMIGIDKDEPSILLWEKGGKTRWHSP